MHSVSPATCKVAGKEGSKFTARKALGILWPTKLFESKGGVGRPARKEEISTVKVGGESHTGVIRDSRFGCPSGCLELFEDIYVSVALQTNLADSASASRPEEVEEWLRAGRQRCALKHTMNEDAEGEISWTLATTQHKAGQPQEHSKAETKRNITTRTKPHRKPFTRRTRTTWTRSGARPCPSRGIQASEGLVERLARLAKDRRGRSRARGLGARAQVITRARATGRPRAANVLARSLPVAVAAL